jgi:hypothetical protein
MEAFHSFFPFRPGHRFGKKKNFRPPLMFHIYQLPEQNAFFPPRRRLYNGPKTVAPPPPSHQKLYFHLPAIRQYLLLTQPFQSQFCPFCRYYTFLTLILPFSFRFTTFLLHFSLIYFPFLISPPPKKMTWVVTPPPPGEAYFQYIHPCLQGSFL